MGKVRFRELVKVIKKGNGFINQGSEMIVKVTKKASG